MRIHVEIDHCGATVCWFLQRKFMTFILLQSGLLGSSDVINDTSVTQANNARIGTCRESYIKLKYNFYPVLCQNQAH